MPTTSSYPSPLHGYENASPLPTEISADGKSLVNIKPGEDTPSPSKAYDEFVDPISKNGGFDFHVYFMHTQEDELKYARELHERIRREFPELRIYRLWEKPIGPHPTGMFEVNTFNPHQTGTLFSWLTIHRGPCSVLVHPNTGNALQDHTELMAWIGPPWPLRTDVL
ncbi:hypothetical protein E1B28_007358 [Marasmius oreades]|uniref:DOPA 4,5-dioxygenase n=1 Tax=Marasmius oreades TaxID=181124 RepID=A0A9P7S380_9AGAR|nr:uncharacterized protein E1B28_007358 [Marasmius oreades]KAG7093703.1 hypothetical protein E1B28_007358 [Marasmius oreades]